MARGMPPTAACPLASHCVETKANAADVAQLCVAGDT